MPADLIDWSLSGHLEIVTAIPTVSTDHGDIAGLVAVPPEDFVRMFRRDGSGPRQAAVRRVRRADPGREDRAGRVEWMRITDPAGGLTLEAADLIITNDEMDRFEENHELAPRPKNYQGGATKWDWEGFYTALIRRIHEHGLPEQQKDLVNEMLGWFERRSETGESPDISTIRKKIASIWRELREDA